MHARPILVLGAALAAFALARPAAAAGVNPNETVDTTMSAAALAQTLVGPGVAVENVLFTGAQDARGTFTFADPAVAGMSQGVILSSGNAHDVVGPNTSDSYSTDWTNPGDADLDALAGYQTFDAGVLEFDFTPVANQVSFQYAFASDEYSEYVNTQFNDVFAFFINGQNCALVRSVAGDPSAAFVPVAVNNINASNPIQIPPPPPVRPDLFRDNAFVDGGVSALDLELDGITRVITCQSAVTPGVVNHMKLAIADASDGVWDSAVFIQAGSLVSNENPTADLGLDPSQGTAPLDVTATVEGHDPNDLPLTYTIDWGDGTVTPGEALPDLTTTATHTYLYGGEWIVTLTVSNGTLTGVDHDDVNVIGPPPPSTTTTTTTIGPTTTTVESTTTTTATPTTTTTTLPAPCPPTPRAGCRHTQPGASTLVLEDSALDAKDKLKWKWAKGDATAVSDFGDPVGGTGTRRLCVYDASGAAQPRLAAAVPAGGTCGTRPCWKPTKNGAAYTNKDATPDGITSLKLKAGLDTKAAVQASGAGTNLAMPVLPLSLPATVQLLIDDGATSTCFETVYTAANRNDATKLAAKGP